MEFLLAFGGYFAVFPQSVSHVWVESDKVKIGKNESLMFNHLIFEIKLKQSKMKIYNMLIKPWTGFSVYLYPYPLGRGIPKNLPQA